MWIAEYIVQADMPTRYSSSFANFTIRFGLSFQNPYKIVALKNYLKTESSYKMLLLL